MFVTFLRGPTDDAGGRARVADDYDLEQVFIGPDDFGARRVQLVDGARPTGENVVETLEASPLSAVAHGARSALFRVLKQVPVRESKGDGLDGFARGDELHPTQAQLDRFLSKSPDAPAYMFNLLEYRDKTAYQRYGVVAARDVARVGGSIVWSARALEGGWHEIYLVRYPSRAAFRHMVTRRAYQDAENAHRVRGLKNTRLYVLSPRGS